MTQPGEPGYPGEQPATADLSNPEQHDSAAAPPPGAPAAEPEASSRAAELVAELDKIRSGAVTGLKAVLRVGKPHTSMTYAGITVTNEPTEVPAHAVPGLSEAAAGAGVELIQEH